MVVAASAASAEPARPDPAAGADPSPAAPTRTASAADPAASADDAGAPPPDVPGSVRLGRDDIARLPGAQDDLARALAALPGVVAFPMPGVLVFGRPHGRAGLPIRGSSPQDARILVDGFEVPVLRHQLGGRSILPTRTIDTADYVPGGFDVAYGRASSGIVSLVTRPGSARGGEVELTTLDGGVLAQTDDRRGTRALVAFRRSLLDLALPSLVPSDVDLVLATPPRYEDAQLRLDRRLTPRWSLQVTGLGADDALVLYPTRRPHPDQRLASRSRFLRLTTAAAYHHGPWSSRLALSGLALEQADERGLVQHARVRQAGVTARAELARTAPRAAGLTHVRWRAGVETAIARTHLDLAMPLARREGQPPPADDPTDTSLTARAFVWTPDLAAWSALEANLDPSIRVTAGLRIDAFTRGHDTALEPRGELAWRLAPTITAHLAAGAYVRPPEYQTELLSSALHPEHATQTIAGLELAPRAGVRVRTSLYYTDRTDLLTYGDDGVTLVNRGRGATTGAELLATLARGPWWGLLAYAYGHSTRLDKPRDRTRLFDDDQPHALEVVVGWRRGGWELGGRYELCSGLPVTPVAGSVFDSDASVYRPLYGPVNSERAPLRYELDLRVARRFRWGPAAMTASLELQNVTADQAALDYVYSYDYLERGAHRALPLLPWFGLRGEL